MKHGAREIIGELIGPSKDVGGIPVPTFLYGTAWKQQRTTSLVSQALRAGFRGIDTANQRRHYHEEGVGNALADAFRSGFAAPGDIFLQTKFTFLPAQDHRLPYDPKASVADQVAQSFASSLKHLGVETIDSYVLHGPSVGRGLSVADLEAWRAMETLQRGGKVKLLGISNFNAEQIALLLGRAEIRPTFVQNRCFASAGWDREVRDICDREGLVYQGFSLLTANAKLLARPPIQRMARSHGRTIAQIVYRFALQIGMIPLTGTTNPRHMKEALAVYDFALATAEMEAIRLVGTS